jgi:hypothetical protein
MHSNPHALQTLAAEHQTDARRQADRIRAGRTARLARQPDRAPPLRSRARWRRLVY